MGTSEMSNSRALEKDPETPGTATVDKTRLRGDKSQLMHGGEVITPNKENRGRESRERCPLPRNLPRPELPRAGWGRAARARPDKEGGKLGQV